MTAVVDGARHGHYYHANSNNARMGRGSVFIAQAKLVIPKPLKKELNQQLAQIQQENAKKKGKEFSGGRHHRFMTKHQIDFLTQDADKVEVVPQRPHRKGITYKPVADDATANEADLGELSDDEKEFFGVGGKTKPRAQSKKSVLKQSNKLTVSQSVQVLPGLDSVTGGLPPKKVLQRSSANAAVMGKAISKATTMYGKDKRGSKPKAYAARRGRDRPNGSTAGFSRTGTFDSTISTESESSPHSTKRAKTLNIETNSADLPPPPPPPASGPATLTPLLQSRTTRTGSDPPAASPIVVEEAIHRLSVQRRRSFGGSVSGKSKDDYFKAPHHHVHVEDTG
eukprot:CAMPEP_0197075536 /NCGR_PEP_ID=MMETSP1384-20130603/211664_1 /TAXON_ID=29189 /ORGANISM="Ammonia sp." /LENGTH=338 /DNA_ID=CAMNT_0042514385 /DNA_START=36 /DNA_END=1048 /DNA_ORIENTATION=-